MELGCTVLRCLSRHNRCGLMLLLFVKLTVRLLADLRAMNRCGLSSRETFRCSEGGVQVHFELLERNRPQTWQASRFF
jgi:hypothetical protein